MTFLCNKHLCGVDRESCTTTTLKNGPEGGGLCSCLTIPNHSLWTFRFVAARILCPYEKWSPVYWVEHLTFHLVVCETPLWLLPCTLLIIALEADDTLWTNVEASFRRVELLVVWVNETKGRVRRARMTSWWGLSPTDPWMKTMWITPVAR